MKRKLDIIVFDPAGNTTIMVLTPVPVSDYVKVAKELLKINFEKYCSWRGTAFGEQVAFVAPEEKDGRKTTVMKMCGLEFCGNASRSFAYHRVLAHGEGEDIGDGKKKIEVSVSGCAHPLTAIVDLKKRDSVIQMPLPADIKMIDTAPAGIEGTYPFVSFDGISHIVIPGVEPDEETFNRIREYMYSEVDPGMDAFGVMFINEEKDLMSPVVYVRDVDTIYFEGSCASGTAAAAVAKAAKAAEGAFEYVFKQPDGTLYATVKKAAGKVTGIGLGGIIEMTEKIRVEI